MGNIYIYIWCLIWGDIYIISDVALLWSPLNLNVCTYLQFDFIHLHSIHIYMLFCSIVVAHSLMLQTCYIRHIYAHDPCYIHSPGLYSCAHYVNCAYFARCMRPRHMFAFIFIIKAALAVYWASISPWNNVCQSLLDLRGLSCSIWGNLHLNSCIESLHNCDQLYDNDLYIISPCVYSSEQRVLYMFNTCSSVSWAKAMQFHQLLDSQ